MSAVGVPQPSPLPVPVRSRWSEPFWDGLAAGRFLLQRCAECLSYQGYPKPMCHSCGATNLTWLASSGRGIVYSHTTVEANPPSSFAGELPYTLVIVELAEGVRYLGRYAGARAPECDMPVVAAFTPRQDGALLPTFTEAPV